MSLLETIKKAVANPEALIEQSKYPIVLNSDDILRDLKPDDEISSEVSVIKRVGGWKISEIDSEIIELGNGFVKKLRRKLKNPKSFGRDEFLGLLNSFLEKCRAKVGVPADVDFSSSGYTRVMVEKVGPFIGRDVVGLILEACINFEEWNVLETLIREGLVDRLLPTNLVEGVIEKKRSDLLCLCIKHASDIRSSDLLSVLKYFLSPSKSAYSTMLNVRKEWESEALLAVEKTTIQNLSGQISSLAKQASLLLMIAYDGFSSSELCMHYLFASSNLDELGMSYCMTRLEGSEMLKLIRYLGKWLRKYERFPQAVPCPKAASTLGLKSCDFVPSLESIVKCLSLVLDDQFSSLVLHSEYHEELKSIDEVVSSLTSEARLYCSLADLVENVKVEVGPGDNV